MNDVREVTIAAKDDVFDDLFKASARIAKFKGEQAEADYVRRDEELRKRIVAVADRLYEPSYVEKHLEIGWDWWPDHTRHLEASIDSFSQAFLDELRALLIDVYKDWRIQVVVYADPLDGQTLVGSIAIWADRLLIDRALYALLKWRGVDLRCAAKPVWRQSAGT
ncbi:hypothetical protein NA78x_004014 [Anatilimnocola sp. NA78]|uniref:hypothetical protein n=1 Tax=Anatilimnocola sp. NA78 TaxID=3415683 RepID=UPI003CE4921B